MKNRADELRKRYQSHLQNYDQQPNESYPNYEKLTEPSQGGHPLFSSEGLLFRLMASVCLFLVVGIIFKNPSANLLPFKEQVHTAFQEEFQFASIGGWYEEQFGEPLALFPTDKTKKTNTVTNNTTQKYALPANAKVLESFKDNGKGVLLETGSDSDVSSIKEGFVIFVGSKDQLGKTVVVQHFDGSESWYGKLNRIDNNIKLYNYIDSGTALGKVTKEENSEAGSFYFAIKDDGGFVDPLKVLSFE